MRGVDRSTTGPFFGGRRAIRRSESADFRRWSPTEFVVTADRDDPPDLHIYTNAGSVVPTIGASGAIAGIMGAYFRFFPHARVETLVPPFVFGPFFVLPAVLFLGWWFVLQFFNGALSLAAKGPGFGGVAWWAHVGGFLFGFSVCLAARRRRVPPRIIEI